MAPFASRVAEDLAGSAVFARLIFPYFALCFTYFRPQSLSVLSEDDGEANL